MTIGVSSRDDRSTKEKDSAAFLRHPLPTNQHSLLPQTRDFSASTFRARLISAAVLTSDATHHKHTESRHHVGTQSAKSNVVDPLPNLLLLLRGARLSIIWFLESVIDLQLQCRRYPRHAAQRGRSHEARQKYITDPANLHLTNVLTNMSRPTLTSHAPSHPRSAAMRSTRSTPAPRPQSKTCSPTAPSFAAASVYQVCQTP